MKFKTVIITAILSIVFLFIYPPVSGQEPGNPGSAAPPLGQRLFYGGNFGLQLGTYTYVEVSPIVGIWLLPRVGVAAGPTYKYLKDPLGNTDVFGGKTFTRLVLIQDINNIVPIGVGLSIYLQAEYERLSYKADFFYTNPESNRINNSAILGGFGFSQHLGPRSSLNISFLWVMNETELDIYDNPEIKVGITF